MFTENIALGHLLLSNEPPSPSEANLAQAQLLAMEQKLQALGPEILRLRDIMNSLELERRQLLSERGGLRGITSAGRRLPSELISEIACFASASSPPREKTSQIIAMMKVCQSWYSSIINTPECFSFCCIKLGREKPGTAVDRITQGASSWCKRASESFPTTLILTSLYDCTQVASQVLDPLIHATGCLRLTFNFPFASLVVAEVMHCSQWRKRDGVEVLSVIDVCNWDGLELEKCPRLPASGPGHTSSFDLPSLRELDIKARRRFHAYSVPVPWHQLTTLNMMTRNDCEHNLAILPLCVELVTCTLWLAPVSLTPPQDQGAFCLPKLRSFRLVCHKISDRVIPVLDYFLDPLRLPSLGEFSIHGGFGRDINLPSSTPSIVDYLVKFVYQSESRLCKLSIVELCSFDETQAKRFIDQIPGSVKLFVHQGGEETVQNWAW